MKKQTMKQLRLGMAILALCSMSVVGGQAFADDYTDLAARVTKLEKTLGNVTTSDTTPTGVKIGKNAKATDANKGIAIGDSAVATIINSIAIGNEARAENDSTLYDAIAIGRSSTANNNRAVAIGATANSAGDSSVAVGFASSATIKQATALGAYASASGGNSLATGTNATALAGNSVATGSSSYASGNAAIANGFQSKALGAQSIAIGVRAKTGATETDVDDDYTIVGTANEAIAIGDKAKAYANQTIAIGYTSKASGVNSSVMGNGATATAASSMALGTSSKSLSASSVAIGDGARTGMLQGTDYDKMDLQPEKLPAKDGDHHLYYKQVSQPAGWDSDGDTVQTINGVVYVLDDDAYYSQVTHNNYTVSTGIDDRYSIAIGQSAAANDYSGIALGRRATSSGKYAIAIGGGNNGALGAQATADQTIAVGVYSKATAVDAIAVGNSAQATGLQSLALMKNSRGLGDYSIAIGSGAQVVKAATNGMALGNNAKVNKENGTAIGNAATVDSESAIALGQGSTVLSSDGNVLSIGNANTNRKIIHVANGVANTDAANYGQLISNDQTIALNAGNKYSYTMKLNNGGNGPTVTLDTTGLGGSGSVSATVTQGDTNAVSGGAVYTEVRPTDGTYVKGTYTTAENLKELDTQVGKNADKITTNAGDIDKLKNMSNLSTDGVNKVKEYAQDAVKVEADPAHKGLTVTKDTTTPNQTTYKVALDKDTIGGEVGIGEVKDGNTGLVTGGTMYKELRPTDGNYVKQNKTTAENLTALDTQVKQNANDIAGLKDMSNLSEKGVSKVKEYAQEAVKVEGDASTGVNVTGTKDDKGNISYKVSIDNNKLSENLGTGKVEENDKGLVTGDTVYTALHDKLGDGQDGTYIGEDATVNANLKALDDAIGAAYDSTNNIAEDDNVKGAVGKLDKAMGQVSSLNGIKGLDNQAIGSEDKPTNVADAVLAVDGKVGNLDPNAKYNALDGKETLAKNLENVDAALGDVNSLYGDTGIKGKGGATVSSTDGLAGVMKAMDGKIGDLDQGKTYNVIDKAASVNDNLTAMDAKMGKLTEDENTIKKDNTVAQNFSALDTAMGDVKKLNAIKDKNGNAIGSDDKATNVADAVVAVDGKVGDLTADGNYIEKGKDLSTNLAAVDSKMGKLTEDGDYVKQDQTFAQNFSALDKGLGKLEKDGNLVKKENSAAANIAIIDTAIGSKDDYGTGYNISTGDDVSLKKNIGALDAAIGTTADGAFVSSGNSVGQNLNALDKGLSDLGDRVNKVGAGAAALAALHVESFDPDDKFNLAVGFGHYKNANSGAIGAFYKPNHDTTFSIATTIGNGDNMLNAGISFKLGKSAHVEKTMVVKADYEALQQKVADQDDRLAAQDAQIEELKKQVAALVARG